MPWCTPPRSGEAAHLSFPTRFLSGGAVVADPDEVALVGHLGVRRGTRHSQVGRDSWRLREFLTVLSDWMVCPPRLFGRARVFRKWATFIDLALDELVGQDPLPLPRDLMCESWSRVRPLGLNVAQPDVAIKVSGNSSPFCLIAWRCLRLVPHSAIGSVWALRT
jgi:hypothetical protein